MPRPFPFAAAAAAWLIAGGAAAANLDVRIIDARGEPIPNAAAPPGDTASTPSLSDKAVIDQNFETFFPLVTILPVGGSLTFHNSDRTMHQVYSFSKIRQFEFEVDVGHTSPPVVFDKAGIAAIGCNIHDQMITYVVATDNPLTKLSDEHGAVHFAGLSPGNYEASVWHPDLAPGAEGPSQSLALGTQDGQLAFALKLTPRHMAHMSHMGSY
jgi:plastocyanin